MIDPLDKNLLKNSATLIGGTVVAQAIPLLLQPILRRYYSTEEFGALAVYLNLFGIITIVSSLRYEAAIMLPKSNHHAANILGLSIFLSVLFNIFLLITLLIFYEEIANLIGLSHIFRPYLFFLPFSGVAFSIFQAINYWLIRQKAFRASTTNKINRRMAEGIIQFTGGLFKIRGGLFWGDFAGNLINLLSGLRQLGKTEFNPKLVSFKKIKWALKKYKDFPIYNTLPTLASSIATTLPYLFINKFYSTQTIAQVDLSRLVLSVPLVFISGTISQVLFQQVAQKKANLQPINSDFIKVAAILFFILTLEFLIIEFFGPFLFAFIFGEPYRISGEISRVLLLSFGLNFFSSSFSFVLIVFEKLKHNALWQISYLLAMAGLYFSTNLSFSEFLYRFVLTDVIWQSILLILIFISIKNYKPTSAL